MVWTGFVGRMVVDSLVECCFFFRWSSRETFLSNWTSIYQHYVRCFYPMWLANHGQWWPALPVEVQPMDVICRLWLHTCSPWALRRGIATGQFVWSLIAIQVLWKKHPKSDLLACGLHPKHPKPFWNFDWLPWLSCGSDDFCLTVGKARNIAARPLNPWKKDSPGAVRFALCWNLFVWPWHFFRRKVRIIYVILAHRNAAVPHGQNALGEFLRFLTLPCTHPIWKVLPNVHSITPRLVSSQKFTINLDNSS